MNSRPNSNPFAGLLAILFLVFIIWLAFKLVKGIFYVLSFLALPLFLVALLLNYRVVVKYFKWVVGLYKDDILKGLLATIGTIIGFPFVALWLFYKAFSSRKEIVEEEKQKPGEYIGYKEVEEDEDFLDLPDSPDTDPLKEKRDDNYDDLFN